MLILQKADNPLITVKHKFDTVLDIVKLVKNNFIPYFYKTIDYLDLSARNVHTVKLP